MPILKGETSVFPQNLLEDFPTHDTEDRQWWAVYTRSRQEKSLARQLLSYEIPFYLPLIPNERLVSGSRVTSHLPLFGGYLFLFGNEDERVKMMTTNRISRVLPVADGAELRQNLEDVQRMIECGEPLTVESRLETGCRVRVKSGGLMGLEGMVIKRRSGTRLLVAVNYLRQGVSVLIDDFMVEPI